MPHESNLSGEFILKPSETKQENKIAKEANTEKEIQHKHKTKFYTSLCINPSDVIFENQEEDEEIILLIRRDLITNIPWIASAALLLIIPPILTVFSDLFTPFFQVSSQTLMLALLFYYLIIIGFILVEFSIWYFNVGLVTNKRIIDLDVSGILYKHVSETRINLVEDVSYSQVGSIRSVFNYGDVLVQTAATFANFEFDRAPEPARIVRIIANMIGGKKE